MAPHHPLATAPEPITDATLLQHRIIAVADSGLRDSASMGLLSGQDIFTVDSMQAKIEAQVRGIGCGFLPHFMADVYVQAGLLVTRQVARPSRNVRMHYAWSCPPQQDPPRALQWWLQQLESPATRRALMENHHRH